MMRGPKRLNWVQNIVGGPRDDSEGTTGADFISEKTVGSNTDVEWHLAPNTGRSGVAKFAIQTTYQTPISSNHIRRYLGFKNI